MTIFKEHYDFRRSDVNDIFKILETSYCAMNHSLPASPAPWGIRKFENVSLDGVNVSYIEGYGATRVERTRAHILDDGRSDFMVVIPLENRSNMAQGGVVRDCGPGRFRVLSVAMPFAGHVVASASHDRYSDLVATIPGAMLRDLVPHLDEFSNISLPLRPGAGAIMKSHFEMALKEGAALSDSQACELSAGLVRWTATAIIESDEYRDFGKITPKSAAQRTYEKACDFILRNLANPELDCTLVARQCQVSVRYLHQVFSPSGTVLDFIREARLQRCRSALRDQKLSARSVNAIAVTWGFTSLSTFSRLYKSRFGMPPSLDRG